ncbi:hypothetical protein PAN31117_01907 [Pandoraea anapnoica]|uniref:Uncharacterized protein n=1 Tax=Pandoraea anapnoica TaxID=2508301 RepID=A0A5E4ZXK8_9BURK|nr:hypothetical protein [Pandoraea anapnoica]VVE65548.1 hypothetical protein PAN31117_01907 [Pandoraea anapnoica]
MNARDLMPQVVSPSQPDTRFTDPPSVREAVNNTLDPAMSAPNGATVVVPVYLEQQPGDSIRIDWNGFGAGGAPVNYDATQPVFGGDVGKEINFTVPQDIVEATAGGQASITYTVTFFWEAASPSPQPRPQTSPPLTLTVLATSAELPVPSVDRVTNGMLDPDANPAGTVARVPAGVTQAGDIVRLYWVGATTYTDWFPVNTGTAGKELPYDIARNFIDENRNRRVSVYYEIERGAARLKSDTLRFSVGEVQLLPAPDIPDAVDGVLDPTGIVDVPIVVPAEADLEPGDNVTVHVDGPKGSDTVSRIVPGSGTGQPLTLLMAVDVFRDNLGDEVEVHYTVSRFVDGREDVSDVRTIRVRAAPMAFPAPRIKEATGNRLEPLDAVNSLTATVNFNGAQPADEVQVTWTGNGIDGSYQSEWLFIGSVPRDIALDPSVVAFNIGNSVTVTYEVRRAGASVGVSDSLTLDVLALDTSPGGPLPTPELKDIEGDELDLELVANGGVITVTPPWPLIAEGQRFWLDLEGTDGDGNVHNYRQANGVLVNAQHVEVGLANRQVPASYFAPLADGSTLRLVFKVTFDGSSNEADAVTFPVRTYFVGKVPAKLTEDFESTENYNFPVNDTQHLEFMDVTNLAGLVRFASSPQFPDPGTPVSGRMLYLIGVARARVEFHFPVRFVRFGCWTGPRSCLVYYYDSNRVLLQAKWAPNHGSAPGAWVDYSRDTADIKYVELWDQGTNTQLDNFTVET